MKKLLLLSAFLIFACSSDDSSDTNDNTSTNDGLIPKTINLYSNGELTSQSNYLYNENNLISITVDESNSGVNYTYNEEGMINKMEFDEYYNQELVGTFKFDYIYNSSNVLVEIISYQENYRPQMRRLLNLELQGKKAKGYWFYSRNRYLYRTPQKSHTYCYCAYYCLF